MLSQWRRESLIAVGPKPCQNVFLSIKTPSRRNVRLRLGQNAKLVTKAVRTIGGTPSYLGRKPRLSLTIVRV
jgi:hypothetical protein